ncbi:MAG: hypothetical protein ABSA85_10595 [Terracidiphilus sp.]|jgi:D-serine deaminase-like pyridoxal phosphate-dependent protein
MTRTAHSTLALAGDVIAFDIAHPCLAFDKWLVPALVSSASDVVDMIQTLFWFGPAKSAPA